MGNIEILSDTYVIPSDFHTTDYITSPWIPLITIHP